MLVFAGGGGTNKSTTFFDQILAERKLISVLLLFFRYMNFMFDLEDASNDGTIDSEEFSTVYSSYGVDKNECLEAFKKMSKVINLCFRSDIECRVLGTKILMQIG